ncbi:hypothetical protein ABWJ92_38490 [Streptomyces sp. NPDC000609]|uniref:hypothetical protein n=1 Tax=Streptomyces sp. NPDC000609 TaxID=3160957 RepID=UPI003391F61E
MITRQGTPVDEDDGQALAVALGLLLLIGSVLLLDAWLGVWWAFGIAAGSVLSAYYVPGVTRWIAVRWAVREVIRRSR